MDTSAENRTRYSALALTIGLHVLLFILFFLIVFITPIPPFEVKPVPEIEIGLGIEGLGRADAGGSGHHDKDIETTEKVVKATTVKSSPSNVVTDDKEESVSVKVNPKNKKDTKAETPVIEDPKPSSELSNALSKLKSKKQHAGSGEGDGNTGGSGTGNKQGVGDGDDTGHGNNTPGFNGKGGYDLKGRALVKKPARMTDSQEEGVVVVEIIVDENGKVTKATPGKRGSTTTSSNLYAKARQAALSVQFDPSPNGIKEQRGTYTFVFVLE